MRSRKGIREKCGGLLLFWGFELIRPVVLVLVVSVHVKPHSGRLDTRVSTALLKPAHTSAGSSASKVYRTDTAQMVTGAGFVGKGGSDAHDHSSVWWSRKHAQRVVMEHPLDSDCIFSRTRYALARRNFVRLLD